MINQEKIIILDFGSQYTRLIARRVREQKVFCEIVPYNTSCREIESINPNGIILSGGPSSVYAKGAPIPDGTLFELKIPILGICYGFQLIGKVLGGKVLRAPRREYGHARLVIDDDEDIFKGLGSYLDVWMSHGDLLATLPPGFKRLGHTENAEIAAAGDSKKGIYGLQFHPEVVHTPHGGKVFRNFLYNICGCTGLWTPEHFVESSVRKIHEQAGDRTVLCALSGGVDSAVTAVLIHRSIKSQLIPVFVDNGLLREGEVNEVRQSFADINLRFVDASKAFLDDLKGVTDPEEKRMTIGKRFIKVFESEADKFGKIDFLAQGTLYPDVIESTSAIGGPSVTIKSHHNVGGLPDRMRLRLIEPLRDLFKDEVRAVGRVLKISKAILNRHPFPGPGLAVRILGEVTEERLNVLRKADIIFIQELKDSGWYDKVWQALTVLLPVQSVGVMGDERTYDHVVALRAVNSLDGMTADWSKLPDDLLNRVSNRIINEVQGINRVVYDISSKPPSTIEWE
jgi:GMP synthase (glutamine-hydrolysing)